MTTPTRQRNSVSQGIAFGLVMRGHTSVPFDKVAVDLAFASAFRGWEYAGRFPQVGTDLRKGLDGTWALTRASGTKQVWVLYWETQGGELTIHVRQPDWDPNDPNDIDYTLSMLDGDVPLEGWTDLAEAFLRRMHV